jgi:Na+-translocating ferredoxin:NAD+ oxidoreductase subunit C
VSIRLDKKTSKRGVPLPKVEIPATGSIEPASLPSTVILPLQRGGSVPNEPLVKKGDFVLVGQVIADSADDGAAPIHASIQGEVAKIATDVDASTGEVVKTIIINGNGGDESVAYKSTDGIESSSSKEIIKKIRDAGIISIGDGMVPVHSKLVDELKKKVDTVLLSGYDSEMYTTANYHLMLEYGQKVLSGLNIINMILAPANVYIAVEASREDAMASIEKLITENKYNFSVVPVKVKYPVVEEKILIDTVLDVEVPMGGVPADVGVAVFDVGVAKAIHEAVYEGKPYIDRVVTVAGAVSKPKNLSVRSGASISSLIDSCGGMTETDVQVIAGGPISGTEQFNLDAPLSSQDSGVLVMKAQSTHVIDCINCCDCVEACPMGLRPLLYPKQVAVRRYTEAQESYIDNCTECGACAYVCPSHIPVLEYIRIAKKVLSKVSK